VKYIYCLIIAAVFSQPLMAMCCKQNKKPYNLQKLKLSIEKLNKKSDLKVVGKEWTKIINVIYKNKKSIRKEPDAELLAENILKGVKVVRDLLNNANSDRDVVRRYAILDQQLVYAAKTYIRGESPVAFFP